MESANIQNGDLNEKETPDVSLSLNNKGMISDANSKATSYLYDLEITENDTESNSSFGDFDSESFWDKDSTSKESPSITNNKNRGLAGSFLNEDSKDCSEVIKNDEKQIFKTEEKKHNSTNNQDTSVQPNCTDSSEISIVNDEIHKQSFSKENNEDLKTLHNQSNNLQSNIINIDQPKEDICRNQKEDLGHLNQDRLTETNVTHECTEKNIQNFYLESEKVNIVNDNFQSSNSSDNLSIDEKVESTKLKCENNLSNENTNLDEKSFEIMKTTNEDRSSKADDKSHLNNQLDINERVTGNRTEKNESDAKNTKDRNEEDDSFGAFDTEENQFNDVNDSFQQDKQESLNQNYKNVNIEIENHAAKSSAINKSEELTDFQKKDSSEVDEFANFDDGNELESDSFADFDDENFSTNDGFGSFGDGIESKNIESQKFDETDNSFGNFSNAGSDQFGDFDENSDGFADFDDTSFENFNDTEVNVEKNSEVPKTTEFKKRDFNRWFSNMSMNSDDKENSDLLLIMSYLNSSTLFKNSSKINNKPETIWNLLKDIDTAVALKFKYEGCKLHRNMLNELNLNSNNIVYQGSTKPYVVPTYFAASLQSMESNVLKPVSATERITANDEKLRNDSSIQKNNEQQKWTTETACSELPPSVVSSNEKDCGITEITKSSQQIEFNLDCFTVDDTTNIENKDQEKDQDKLDPDLLKLAQLPSSSKAGKSPGQDKISKLLATIKSTRKEEVATSNAEEELSAEVREHLGKLPDISYMRSSVLMFPSDKKDSD